MMSDRCQERDSQSSNIFLGMKLEHVHENLGKER